jgi:hypothetical protein
VLRVDSIPKPPTGRAATAGDESARPSPRCHAREVKLAAILVGSITLFTVTGCGSDAHVSAGPRAAVVKAVRTFQSAFTTGNGRAACQAMSPAGRLLAQRQGHGSCAADLTEGGTPDAGDWRQAEPYVHQVIIDGSSAQVVFGTSKTRVFEFQLARARNGRWGVSVQIEQSSQYKL